MDQRYGSGSFIPLQPKLKVMKTFLVTGASNGIGYETAVHLCKAGHQVIAVARNKEKLLALQSFAGDKLFPLVADLTGEFRDTVSEYLEDNDFSAIHAVIHNAGFLVNHPFENITAADLRKSYEVNVFAPFILTQTLLPWLRNAEVSHVVMISSMGGVQGSAKFAGLSAYSSSKGALTVLSECLALELSSYKISVNCLALGSVQTEMLEAAFPGYKAPLTPDQMGEFVSWFAAEGNKYFNGKILPVALSTP